VPRAGREVSGAPDAEPLVTDGPAGFDVVPWDDVDAEVDTPLGGGAGRVPTGGVPTGFVWTGGIASVGVLTDGVVMLGVVSCGVLTGPTVTEGAVTAGTVTDGTDTVGTDEADGRLTSAAPDITPATEMLGPEWTADGAAAPIDGGVAGVAAVDAAAETANPPQAARTVSKERLMGLVATRVYRLRRTQAAARHSETSPRSR
jgi:hypothetical protein